MDDRTFDTVVRAVSVSPSRRHALRLLAAGVLAALLPKHAGAAPARQADGCEPGLIYCPGVAGAFVCVRGDCICGDRIFCDGQCTDGFTDPSNCGGCGIVCASGVCEAGGCVPSGVGCEAGLTYCDEQPGWEPAGCYDLASDYHHCGDCMHHCPSAGPVDMACIGGACVTVNCGDLTDCTGNLDCADLASDPFNCGGCGVVCDSGVCEDGSCSVGCGEGLAHCPARTIGIGFNEEPYALPAGCYDLFSDRNHCGTCETTCATTVGCYAGECTVPPM